MLVGDGGLRRLHRDPVNFAQLADAILLEIGRHRDAIDKDRDLVALRVFVDFEPVTRALRSIKVIQESVRLA